MEERPKLLKMLAGEAYSIFKVPQFLVRHNEKAYEPRLVSIGPYHHGKDNLKMMEEHKPRYLKLFAKESGVDCQNLFDAVSSIEGKIRDSYSKEIDKNGEELTEMMVLDGCFILTLLRGSYEIDYPIDDDPILNCVWIVLVLAMDFMLLENQIPFVVLQTLLQTSEIPKRKNVSASSLLNEMVTRFYFLLFSQGPEFWERHLDVETKHILHLLHHVFKPIGNQETPNVEGEKCCHPLSFWRISKQKSKQFCLPITRHHKEQAEDDKSPSFLFILSASKLHRRGIKFKPREKNEGMLDIKYEKGVLHIPPLIMDDFIISFLLNSVAFEQFYKDCPNHFTSYVVFMAYILNSPADASFLSNAGIIRNYSGTEEEISRLFKNFIKDVAWENNGYLNEVYEGVNEYSSKGWKVEWAEFKHTYFDHPWTFLSSFAAVILLLLTVVQSFFAAYAYFRPPKQK